MCGITGVSCKNCRRYRAQAFPLLLRTGEHTDHRGGQGHGFGVMNDDGKIICHRQPGNFGEGINEETIDEMTNTYVGHLGLTHSLYATTTFDGNKKQVRRYQPAVASFHGGEFGLSFNGNVYDLSELRVKAEDRGWKFESKISDTEAIVAAISTSPKTDFVEALKEVLPQLKGGFSLVMMHDGKIIAARDSFGIRPLCVGHSDEATVVSSESCAFYPIGARFIRDIRPGEITVIGDQIERYIQWTDNPGHRFCIFELIYFGRPDSRLCSGKSGWHYRNRAGTLLAKEAPVNADLIIPVPDGGNLFAEAYASALGIPISQGLFRNRRGVRTFLTPRGTDRRALQRIKLHPLSEVIWGKRVCLVEDSLVRLKVLPETILMVFEAGAKEVHVRIGSAPVTSQCFYGIDMATKGELAAANFALEQIRQHAGADSLKYLSFEGMIVATGLPKNMLCTACFDGDYPVAPPIEV